MNVSIGVSHLGFMGVSWVIIIWANFHLDDQSKVASIVLISERSTGILNLGF